MKKKICLVNIRRINLSFDELKLIEQVRNISGYENKSKEDLTKALSKPKSESPKPEIPKKPEMPKPELPNPEIPKLRTSELKASKIISSKLKISKSKIPKPKPRQKIRVINLKNVGNILMNQDISLIKKKQIGTEKLFMMLKTIKIFLYQK